MVVVGFFQFIFVMEFNIVERPLNKRMKRLLSVSDIETKRHSNEWASHRFGRHLLD